MTDRIKKCTLCKEVGPHGPCCSTKDKLLSIEERQQLVELRNSGKTYLELGTIFNRHPNTVRYYYTQTVKQNAPQQILETL